MDDDLDLCFDAYPRGEGFDPARLPRPGTDGPASPEELAFAWDRRWQAGQELRVRFMDGDAQLQRRVQEHASTWLHHANLRFTFGNLAGAEIRVTFNGKGNRSLVGIDARDAPRNGPTMVLGGLHRGSDERRLRRAVLHEFGHAIGCVHEQASPAAAIPWDEPKVIAFYRAHEGWDEATVRRNVLLRYGPHAGVWASTWDPKSIMQYPVSKSLTTNGFEVGWNDQLSDGDKAFIARMYPGRR
jgi:hypothetical protein